jgi:acyl-ACP thioesterase
MTELTELVPEPKAGRVFEDSIWPGFADAAPSGRVRLDGIARWLQDVAFRDSADADFEGIGVWILRRLRIRAETFPRFGNQARLRTFCSGAGRFSAERRTTIEAGPARVESVGLWVLLDSESGRPLRFPPEFAEIYAESAAGRDASPRLHHPGPPPGISPSPWFFRATDLDPAGHVNNSNYWAPLEEELAAGPEPESIDVEIEFHDPAVAGPAQILRDGDGMWITSPDGALHASILISP